MSTIDPLTVSLALLRRQLAQRFQLLSHQAGLTEHGYTQRVERFERRRGCDLLQSLIDLTFEVAHEKSTSTKKYGESGGACSPHNHASRIRDAKSVADYAARLALAFSANAPNAAMSCTAMSASTLRSTVMLAFFRPFIRRL